MKSLVALLLVFSLLLLSSMTMLVQCFVVKLPPSSGQHQHQQKQQQQLKTPPASAAGPSLAMTEDQQIISPFDDTQQQQQPAERTRLGKDVVLDLTWENVELVLDELRPFLIQDGGNVIVKDIDGPVVKLELQGACGSCPSSTQTMKMGLERGLKEKIPEIQEVIQAMPEGPELCDDEINVVLDGVRPFLQVAGGTIDIDRIEGLGGLQPSIWLEMKGSSASLNSVKLEIAQRLQRHFMLAGMQVQWV